MKRAILAALLTLPGGCITAESQTPVTISLISDGSARSRSAVTEAPEIVTAIAQGLVAFDQEGQIQPALAERWIVTDDGLSVIFRIRRTKWSDGREVTSAAVARSLQRIVASRNRLQPLLGTIDRIVPMTGQVLEIRLKTPQRDFLQLLAQPEMALTLDRRTNGSGPYQVHSVRDNVTRLRPIAVASDDAPPPVTERNDIRLRREPAAQAVARFAGREIALVTGGRFSALPLVRSAGIAAGQFRVDPAVGLFGFAAASDSKTLDNVNVRRALAMAIDRERLVGRFGVNGWVPRYAILPGQIDSAAAPAVLEWVGLDRAARLARARTYLAESGTPDPVRIALPPGAGSRLLFAAIAADWQQIGVAAVRVGLNEAADLRLVDEVAPMRSALWFLSRFSCGRGFICSDKADTALRSALSADTLSARAAAIAEADAAMASEQLFIPLAAPLRWSLVSADLTGWRTNNFSVHPLADLRKRSR